MTEPSVPSLEVSIRPEHLQRLYEGFGKVILLILLTISVVVFVAGGIKMVLEFIGLWTAPLQVGIQAIVIDILALLALFEIYLTILTYFKESRVKVTYVIDSVFIIMLTELLKLWFGRQATVQNCGVMIAALLSLAVIRLLAIRFSPSKEL